MKGYELLKKAIIENKDDPSDDLKSCRFFIKTDFGLLMSNLTNVDNALHIHNNLNDLGVCINQLTHPGCISKK